jgi:glycogen synthase
MACGCPVVATDIPVVNEMITHGSNGLLVKPEDPVSLAEGIITLLKNRSLRSTLVAGGYQTLERYAEPDLIAQIEHVYDEAERK